MSKKNNRAIKARYHKQDLERENEAALKKQRKAEKKRQKASVRTLASQSKAIVKPKRKGIRIRKGVTVKGIKVEDAASKRRVRVLLAQDRAERAMDVDKPVKTNKKAPRKIKPAKKAAKPAASGPAAMEQ